MNEIIGVKTFIEGPLPKHNIYVMDDAVWHLSDKGVDHVETEDGEYDSYWIVPDEVYTITEFAELLNSNSINTEDAIMEIVDMLLGGE